MFKTTLKICLLLAIIAVISGLAGGCAAFRDLEFYLGYSTHSLGGTCALPDGDIEIRTDLGRNLVNFNREYQIIGFSMHFYFTSPETVGALPVTFRIYGDSLIPSRLLFERMVMVSVSPFGWDAEVNVDLPVPIPMDFEKYVVTVSFRNESDTLRPYVVNGVDSCYTRLYRVDNGTWQSDDISYAWKIGLRIRKPFVY